MICSPQINLHLTDWINDNQFDDVVVQHNCIHVVTTVKEEIRPYQIIPYCLGETPTKWNIQENNLDQKFTFDQLYQQNITSQQLYLWSAPMDLIEQYEFYLNQSSMSSQLYYNCTSPRFGPLCQYSLDIYQSDHLSLNEIIHEFYQQEYEPTTLTCYEHLECNRGSTLSCLDWSEICDGHVDCLNDQIDEKNCWQLEMNECGKNEYRCDNGQCIDKIFFHDNPYTYECLDRSDELRDIGLPRQSFINEPTFVNEDIVCSIRYYEFQIKFSSSCVFKRDNLLKMILFLDTPNSLSDICWLAFKCTYNMLHVLDPRCHQLCLNNNCKQLINETCPDFLVIPAGPLVFGHVYIAYMTKILINSTGPPEPHYICYNDQLCDGFYPNKSLIMFNNLTCRSSEDFPVSLRLGGRYSLIDLYVKSLYSQLFQCNTILHNNVTVCNKSTMYQCINSSKCISKYRLCDGKNDCDHKDDEHCPLINDTCSTHEFDRFFKCTVNNKCISLKLVNNGICEDEYTGLDFNRRYISFATICDGFTELIPFTIDGRNETDETECEYWQCNNTYTRCDGFWNCFNGADEVDCDSLPLLKCPSHHHICISLDTYQLMCLPINKANDGNVDCLGGTDEPKLCRANDHQLGYMDFYCTNDTIQPCVSSRNICYLKGRCMHGDDEVICDSTRNNGIRYNPCIDESASIRTNVQTFLCQRRIDIEKKGIGYFSLGKMEQPSKELIIQQEKNRSPANLPTHLYDQRCHRGLPIRVWLNNDKNVTNTTCFCPPSFYGNLCQYQNQRVSLTVQFQTYSDSRRTLFALIILLIDDSNERIIHSYQQITYLYIEHCKTKFNMYLLYSNRPKLLTRNYSIHIDIYEKISFVYRGSLLIPLNYSFLPVHRIAVQFNIPRSNDNMKICSDKNCKHGRCIRYPENLSESSFCQCHSGWSGRYCTIQYTCSCSSDSLCVGITTNNRSICVCPVNKWGSRCVLHKKICHSDGENTTCQNGGQCIANDENMISSKQFICLCPKGFSGERCEKIDSKIIITFDKNIILPPSILIHFIRVIDNSPPENGSTFKTILTSNQSITIQWPCPFHIAFVELLNHIYYLITVREIYHQSSIISKMVNSSDRCKHISEVLNRTIVNFHLLRRIKYFHLPCQTHSPLLSCFYDDTHFCLCNQRVANCFEFNSSMKHDCFGRSNCENGAQCLQDRPTCPQTSICVCPKCFYGTRCQFSSNLFSASFDSILGHHIQPHIHMKHQSHIVKISIALAMILIIAGLINSILSLITFTNKGTQKVGCGLYLLGSSINALIVVIMFTLKFSILIITQMKYITNQPFLNIQCYSIDFILYICLDMDQWLSACIAIERACTLIKGIHFNKNKSKQMAKYIISFVIFLAFITHIHDPIHRRLLYDDNNDDEKRIWCIVTYSTALQIYNIFIHMFHFFAPFIINIISALIIIIIAARQRSQMERQQSYQYILREQFHQHRHLLIAPIILIILALPRLIISFISNCLNSTDNTWLFLIGYFLSFLPSIVTFIVFVLPSKSYKKQFKKTVKRYLGKVQLRLYRNS